MKMDNEKYIRSLVGHIPMHRPVAVLVIYKDNKVLLQKRSDNGMWALHGGGMELGETYLETLRREIKEELNIEPINPELMGIFSGEKMYHKYEKSQDEVYSPIYSSNGTPFCRQKERLMFFALLIATRMSHALICCSFSNCLLVV